jgi:hypothetical protein
MLGYVWLSWFEYFETVLLILARRAFVSTAIWSKDILPINKYITITKLLTSNQSYYLLQ